jgi:uncharacterized protein
MPCSTEEKIVTHADNLIAGKKRITIHESIGSAIYLPRKARKRMERLSCDVELLCDEKAVPARMSRSTTDSQQPHGQENHS